MFNITLEWYSKRFGCIYLAQNINLILPYTIHTLPYFIYKFLLRFFQKEHVKLVSCLLWLLKGHSQ